MKATTVISVDPGRLPLGVLNGKDACPVVRMPSLIAKYDEPLPTPLETISDFLFASRCRGAGWQAGVLFSRLCCAALLVWAGIYASGLTLILCMAVAALIAAGLLTRPTAAVVVLLGGLDVATQGAAAVPAEALAIIPALLLMVKGAGRLSLDRLIGHS